MWTSNAESLSTFDLTVSFCAYYADFKSLAKHAISKRVTNIDDFLLFWKFYSETNQNSAERNTSELFMKLLHLLIS
jgi:hypothetical protein